MFNPEKFIQEKVAELKQSITGHAIIAISGGVDSTTAALLVNKAIGKNLTCVLVDNGFMRKDEIENIKKTLETLELNLMVVDSRETFLEALEGVTDPEEKRRIIGGLFIKIFEEIAAKCNAEYLVQGTIAPDWIESGGGLRDRIKTHHNVGGLPEQMHLKLIEPLRDLYKDEVRQVAQKLGLPAYIHTRQPFPGPGLAVRVVGELTSERVEIVREAQAIVEDEIERAVASGKIRRPWQYFAVLLPVKAVGVHGDVRVYQYVIVVRAVESVDGMSAEYSKIPHEVLERISTRITNELKDRVSRVVYDITNKPPGTIEYE
jgi:GMP synthase (glutamine-hydrolysing)